ncbi:MAG: hypothetical protein BM564_00630 [Bacteroidetes bacterium MedPE-SWsnd-G2]|nr:MAG: hypothetical protein BM564_00630 [Bacteroidetes bacterium MedPE-SWsnd-G2]
MNKVSVVIPLYNKSNHILDTLNCAFSQSFQDFEIVIVDDGSTDDGLQKVKALNHPKITLYTIKNQGVSYARNYGIQKANTGLIAFLDADDSWSVNHLQQLVDLHSNFPNCGLYATAYAGKKHGKIIESQFQNIPNTPWTGLVDDYFKSSTVNCIAWTSAVMLPKSILSQYNGFDERITMGAGEDTDLWMRVALDHPIAFNNQVSAFHHLDSDNRITNSKTNLRRFIDLDVYEARAKTNSSLKHYLDLNRFSIALQYKQAGNNQAAQNLIDKLDYNNLNSKQKWLLKLNGYSLRTLSQLKEKLHKSGINLSSFR